VEADVTELWPAHSENQDAGPETMAA
jgi:hypothetical protein